MQRRRMAGIPVAACEVNAHCEVDLTAPHDVIQEGVGPHDLCCVCVCIHVYMCTLV